MKKILIVFLMFVPFIAKADNGLELRNQILDNQIEKLTNDRDTKYEALQKCEKSTKGFKIAGLTTLVATGFGIYGNIKLAQKLNGKKGGVGGGGGKLSGDPRSREQINIDNCEIVGCPTDPNECEICINS